MAEGREDSGAAGPVPGTKGESTPNGYPAPVKTDHITGQPSQAVGAFALLMRKRPTGPGDLDSGSEDMDSEDDYEDSLLDQVFYDESELLDWPHEHYADCICWDPSLQYMDFRDFYEMFRNRTSMNENEMKEYHDRLWEHEWMPTRFERPNYKPGRAGVVYEHCKPLELKKMVVNRGLPDLYPAGITLNFYYARLLRKDDREATFGFMDLPPELRINVCRLLFATGYDKPKDAAILRTCREIYEEVKDLPYSMPIVAVEVRIRAHNSVLHTRDVTVHGITESLGGPHGRFYCLPRSIDDYPEYIRRIHRLEIRLSYRNLGSSAPDTDVWSELNQFLFGLSSFLMEGHQMRDLIIHLEPPDGAEDAAFEKCLYPLRRIRNVQNITFEGNIPEHVTQKLKREMSGFEPVFNTLRQWRLLQEEASSQLDLLRELDCFGCDCGECGPPTDRVAQLMSSLYYLDVAKRLCCSSSTHEENFLARLAKLKKALQSTNTSHLEKLVQKILEKRKEVKKYDEIADDGRLDEAMKLWGGDVYNTVSTVTRPCHDWSDDEDNETEGVKRLQLDDPNNRKILSNRAIADIFERWEPGVEGMENNPTPRPSSAASSHFKIPDEDFEDA